MLTYGDSSISLGTLFAVPLILVLAGVAAFAGWRFLRWARANEGHFDEGAARWVGLGLFATAVCFIVGLALGMYPWKAEYHTWQDQTGTVEAIESRQFVSGKAERFVVLFRGGEERSCDDTRCALVRPGDVLTLTCKREWQYAGEDGWSCNYREVERA